MPLSQESPSRSISLAKRYLPFATAAVVIVGGVLSIVGWVKTDARLIDWFAAGITIKFNTAVGLTSAGLALLLAAFSPKLKIPSSIFALLALLIGSLTILQYSLGVNFGIDTLFFNEPAGSPATTSPGRMGMPAATALTLIGTALIILNYQTLRPWASLLGTIVAGISTVSLVGKLYVAEQLYSVAGVTGISLQTAWMILVLGIGMIAVVPERGLAEVFFRDDAGGKAFRLLFVSTFTVVLIGGWLRVVAYDSRYLDSSLGSALRTIIEIVAIIALLWWAANKISHAEVRAVETEKARFEVETHRRIAFVQEAERRRLSRDLHDHTGQQLTGLRLKLESARANAEKSDPKLAAELESISEEARRLDGDMSFLAWELRPNTLDDNGLAEALKSFVREWSVTHGIKAEFHATDADIRMRPEIETNLYRIAQEALNNILKYASATEVTVTLDCSGEEAVMIVEDNGVGFKVDDYGLQHVTGSGGLGLVGMQERAALLGGNVQIESSPNSGTSVFARVPATC